MAAEVTEGGSADGGSSNGRGSSSSSRLLSPTETWHGAYHALRGYFGGDNSSRRKLSMTVPVYKDSRGVMSWYLGADYKVCVCGGGGENGGREGRGARLVGGREGGEEGKVEEGGKEGGKEKGEGRVTERREGERRVKVPVSRLGKGLGGGRTGKGKNCEGGG